MATYSKFTDPARNAMTLEGFTSFLISSDNTALDESLTKQEQDMTHPLPEYFINSSHNVWPLFFNFCRFYWILKCQIPRLT
jgi:hypothetical protein